MTDDELAFFNKRGLIPADQETQEEFLKRVSYCLNLKNLYGHDKLGDEILNGVLPLKEYDVNPDWVPVLFSNSLLSWWHGGCAWIFQMSEGDPLGAVIQLKEAFKKKSLYLGLYSREELIRHELCHVGRMSLDQNKYEEFLAYRTSPRKFSAWLGPLFRSSYESLAFVILVFFTFLMELLLFLDGSFNLFIFLAPLVFIAYLTIRLIMSHRTLNKTAKLLSTISKDSEAILYRLTDKEIDRFSTLSSDEIRKEINLAKSLRMRQIVLAYVSQ